MKKKLVAILLLVAIFAGFAGQVYAVSMNGQIVEEDPNGPIPGAISWTTEFTSYQGSSVYYTAFEYGHAYSGRLKYDHWYENHHGEKLYVYSGTLYLNDTH